MSAQPEVEVLLSTYDGERYLRQQVLTVLDQRGVHVRILARDDGSKDRSREILRELAAEADGRIAILEDGLGNLGPRGSFEALLRASTGPLVAFCDQDDAWHPDKLAAEAALIAELGDGGKRPALVFSDLRLVDEEGKVLSDSFFASQGLDPARSLGVRGSVLQNRVVGCTVLANRALAELALPFPPEAIMHDWWLALCAAAFGAIDFLPRPTIDYRQHGANAIGAKSTLERAASAWRRRGQAFLAIAQARALAARDVAAEPETQALLEALARSRGALATKAVLLRHGATKDGALRNLFFFALAWPSLRRRGVGR